MRARLQVFLIASFAITSCEKKTSSPSIDTAKPAHEQTSPEPDKTGIQTELGDNALTIFSRLSRSLSSISDEKSARQAVEEITSIHDELQSLAEKMKQASNPPHEIAAQFHNKIDATDRAQRAKISQSMQALQATPETAMTINRALEALAKIRNSEAFMAYGF